MKLGRRPPTSPTLPVRPPDHPTTRPPDHPSTRAEATHPRRRATTGKGLATGAVRLTGEIRGIAANVVDPGLTETDATAGIPAEFKARQTPATPLGRVGSPADIAGAIAFFCGDGSGLSHRHRSAGERWPGDGLVWLKLKDAGVVTLSFSMGLNGCNLTEERRGMAWLGGVGCGFWSPWA